MKVRCPKCGTVSNVDPAKIPADGMHARCPKCNNRMFIKKPGGGPSPGTGKKKPGPAAELRGPAKAAPSGERASEAIRKAALQRAEEDDIDFDPPIVKPDNSLGYYGCLVVLAVAIVVSGIFIYIGTTSGPEEADVKPPPPPQVAGQEPSPFFYRDLVVLRRTLLQFKGRSYTAMGARPECRLIFEMMEKCGRGCGQVIRAEIAPLPNGQGFTADVVCGGDEKAHKVNFLWGKMTLTIDGEECG